MPIVRWSLPPTLFEKCGGREAHQEAKQPITNKSIDPNNFPSICLTNVEKLWQKPFPKDLLVIKPSKKQHHPNQSSFLTIHLPSYKTQYSNPRIYCSVLWIWSRQLRLKPRRGSPLCYSALSPAVVSKPISKPCLKQVKTRSSPPDFGFLFLVVGFLWYLFSFALNKIGSLDQRKNMM